MTIAERSAAPRTRRPSSLTGVTIAGIGSCLPAAVLTNDDLGAWLDTDDGWIVARTGIRSRHVASATESTATLAVAAALAALADGCLDVSDIDLVIVATCTPETPMPSTAAHVVAALGSNAGALDVDAACAGFAYGLITAATLSASGVAPRVLLIGAETMTRVVDPSDRSTAVLFGDGAAAVVLCGRGPSGPGLVASDIASAPEALELLGIDGGGSRTPTSVEVLVDRSHFLHMSGREVFRTAVREVSASVQRVIAEAAVLPEDIRWFVPHQANARIVDAVVARTGLIPERVLGNGDRLGNTSAASIPLVLAEQASSGVLHDGDLVLMTGFGAGLSVATVLWDWRRS